MIRGKRNICDATGSKESRHTMFDKGTNREKVNGSIQSSLALSVPQSSFSSIGVSSNNLMLPMSGAIGEDGSG